MPDNNPIYRGHLAKVNSLVPNEKRENTMNITIQRQSLGQYPVTIYGVYSNLLEGVEQGQSYNFTLARGNRKDQHKESAGEQDWMYFWNVASVSPSGATPQVQAEPTQGNVVYDTPQPSQYDMRQAAIMYQNMYGNVSAVGATHDWDGAMTFAEKLDEIGKEADRMFNLKYKPILDGQLPPEPEPEEDDPF